MYVATHRDALSHQVTVARAQVILLADSMLCAVQVDTDVTNFLCVVFTIVDGSKNEAAHSDIHVWWCFICWYTLRLLANS